MRFRLLRVTMVATARMLTRNSRGLCMTIVARMRLTVAVAWTAMFMTWTLARGSGLVAAPARFAVAVAWTAMLALVLMTRTAISAVALFAPLRCLARAPRR